MTEEIELANQEKIGMCREKDTYKYMGMFEADTIKLTEMKEEILKNVSQENEKTTPNQTVYQ